MGGNSVRYGSENSVSPSKSINRSTAWVDLRWPPFTGTELHIPGKVRGGFTHSRECVQFGSEDSGGFVQVGCDEISEGKQSRLVSVYGSGSPVDPLKWQPSQDRRPGMAVGCGVAIHKLTNQVDDFAAVKHSGLDRRDRVIGQTQSELVPHDTGRRLDGKHLTRYFGDHAGDDRLRVHFEVGEGFQVRLDSGAPGIVRPGDTESYRCFHSRRHFIEYGALWPVSSVFRELTNLRVIIDKIVYMPALEAPPDRPYPFVYFITIDNQSDGNCHHQREEMGDFGPNRPEDCR